MSQIKMPSDGLLNALYEALDTARERDVAWREGRLGPMCTSVAKMSCASAKPTCATSPLMRWAPPRFRVWPGLSARLSRGL